MTEAEKWLQSQAEQFADIELIKLMPLIRKTIINSYIKGFSTASLIAANSQRKNIDKQQDGINKGNID